MQMQISEHCSYFFSINPHSCLLIHPITCLQPFVPAQFQFVPAMLPATSLLPQQQITYITSSSSGGKGFIVICMFLVYKNSKKNNM